MNTKLTLTPKKLKTFAIIAAIFVVLYFLRAPISHFMSWVSDQEAVTATVDRAGFWGPLLLFALLVAQVFVAIIPGHALILTGAYAYGFWISMLITLSSTVLGSEVAFFVARKYGRSAVYRLADSSVIEKWDRIADRQGALFYFFTFVLPIFPSDLMCYVAGLGTVHAGRFLIANLLGRLVCAVFVTLIGAHGLHMPVAFWVAALVIVIGFYAAWLVYSRRGNSSNLGVV